MSLPSALLSLFLGCASATFAVAAPQSSLDWDEAFADRSGSTPLHFVAQYQDARGPHRLEEWRDGLAHLRRRTDTRIDLHADATRRPHPGQPVDYIWQIVDLDKKIDSRISSQAMLQTGMLYSFWSMAHVLTRPAGRFTIAKLNDLPSPHLAGQSCTWYRILPDGQPGSRVCWSPSIAAPLAIQNPLPDGSWATVFTIQTLDRKPVPQTIFALDTTGLQVRNVDQLASED